MALLSLLGSAWKNFFSFILTADYSLPLSVAVSHSSLLPGMEIPKILGTWNELIQKSSSNLHVGLKSCNLFAIQMQFLIRKYFRFENQEFFPWYIQVASFKYLFILQDRVILQINLKIGYKPTVNLSYRSIFIANYIFCILFPFVIPFFLVIWVCFSGSCLQIARISNKLHY